MRRRIGAFLTALVVAMGLSVAIAAPAHAADPAFGPVRIIAAGQSKCLDVTGVSQDNGAQIQLYDCLPNQWNQQWYFYDVPGCFQCYQIVPRHSWKCLDVTGYSYETGMPLQQYDCLGFQQLNQVWGITYWFGGSYLTLQAIHDHKSVSYNGAYNGSPVFQSPSYQFLITSSYLG